MPLMASMEICFALHCLLTLCTVTTVLGNDGGLTCGFEQNFCGWTNNGWQRKTQSPLSSSGPDAAADGSYYIQINITKPNIRSTITADFSKYSGATCLKFSRHLYGQHVERLTFGYYTDTDRYIPLHNITQKEDFWRCTVFYLTSLPQSAKGIYLMGIGGISEYSIIALDNIVLSYGRQCSNDNECEAPSMPTQMSTAKTLVSTNMTNIYHVLSKENDTLYVVIGAVLGFLVLAASLITVCVIRIKRSQKTSFNPPPQSALQSRALPSIPRNPESAELILSIAESFDRKMTTKATASYKPIPCKNVADETSEVDYRRHKEKNQTLQNQPDYVTIPPHYSVDFGIGDIKNGSMSRDTINDDYSLPTEGIEDTLICKNKDDLKQRKGRELPSLPLSDKNIFSKGKSVTSGRKSSDDDYLDPATTERCRFSENMYESDPTRKKSDVNKLNGHCAAIQIPETAVNEYDGDPASVRDDDYLVPTVDNQFCSNDDPKGRQFKNNITAKPCKAPSMTEHYSKITKRPKMYCYENYSKNVPPHNDRSSVDIIADLPDLTLPPIDRSSIDIIANLPDLTTSPYINRSSIDIIANLPDLTTSPYINRSSIDIIANLPDLTTSPYINRSSIDIIANLPDLTLPHADRSSIDSIANLPDLTSSPYNRSSVDSIANLPDLNLSDTDIIETSSKISLQEDYLEPIAEEIVTPCDENHPHKAPATEDFSKTDSDASFDNMNHPVYKTSTDEDYLEPSMETNYHTNPKQYESIGKGIHLKDEHSMVSDGYINHSKDPNSPFENVHQNNANERDRSNFKIPPLKAPHDNINKNTADHEYLDLTIENNRRAKENQYVPNPTGKSDINTNYCKAPPEDTTLCRAPSNDKGHFQISEISPAKNNDFNDYASKDLDSLKTDAMVNNVESDINDINDDYLVPDNKYNVNQNQYESDPTWRKDKNTLTTKVPNIPFGIETHDIASDVCIGDVNESHIGILNPSAKQRKEEDCLLPTVKIKFQLDDNQYESDPTGKRGANYTRQCVAPPSDKHQFKIPDIPVEKEENDEDDYIQPGCDSDTNNTHAEKYDSADNNTADDDYLLPTIKNKYQLSDNQYESDPTGKRGVNHTRQCVPPPSDKHHLNIPEIPIEKGEDDYIPPGYCDSDTNTIRTEKQNSQDKNTTDEDYLLPTVKKKYQLGDNQYESDPTGKRGTNYTRQCVPPPSEKHHFKIPGIPLEKGDNNEDDHIPPDKIAIRTEIYDLQNKNTTDEDYLLPTGLNKYQCGDHQYESDPTGKREPNNARERIVPHSDKHHFKIPEIPIEKGENDEDDYISPGYCDSNTNAILTEKQNSPDEDYLLPIVKNKFDDNQYESDPTGKKGTNNVRQCMAPPSDKHNFKIPEIPIEKGENEDDDYIPPGFCDSNTIQTRTEKLSNSSDNKATDEDILLPTVKSKYRFDNNQYESDPTAKRGTNYTRKCVAPSNDNHKFKIPELPFVSGQNNRDYIPQDSCDAETNFTANEKQNSSNSNTTDEDYLLPTIVNKIRFDDNQFESDPTGKRGTNNVRQCMAPPRDGHNCKIPVIPIDKGTNDDDDYIPPDSCYSKTIRNSNETLNSSGKNMTDENILLPTVKHNKYRPGDNQYESDPTAKRGTNHTRPCVPPPTNKPYFKKLPEIPVVNRQNDDDHTTSDYGDSDTSVLPSEKHNLSEQYITKEGHLPQTVKNKNRLDDNQYESDPTGKRQTGTLTPCFAPPREAYYLKKLPEIPKGTENKIGIGADNKSVKTSLYNLKNIPQIPIVTKTEDDIDDAIDAGYEQKRLESKANNIESTENDKCEYIDAMSVKTSSHS